MPLSLGIVLHQETFACIVLVFQYANNKVWHQYPEALSTLNGAELSFHSCLFIVSLLAEMPSGTPSPHTHIYTHECFSNDFFIPDFLSIGESWVMKSPAIIGLMLICIFKSSSTF